VEDSQYSAKGKTPNEILEDFEAGLIAARFGGNTAEYMQAALTASAARVQERAGGEHTTRNGRFAATLGQGVSTGGVRKHVRSYRGRSCRGAPLRLGQPAVVLAL
jgi:hypothetical protein